MFVGANCVRPLMIDNENVVIYTKNAQNRNIFWRPQVAPTVRYDGLCIKQTDKLKLAVQLLWALAHHFKSVPFRAHIHPPRMWWISYRRYFTSHRDISLRRNFISLQGSDKLKFA